MRLHDWLYDLVGEVCYDREYLYLFFLKHFQALMAEVIEQGRSVASGTYTMPGRKSDRQASLRWRLSRRVDWTAPNVLVIDWEIQDRYTGATRDHGIRSFALSTGEAVPGPAAFE